MAMDANSRIASAVHPLTGSSKPGSDTHDRLRASYGPKTRLAPAANEREMNALAQRLVALLKREPGLVRRLDMLRLHALLPDKQAALEKVIHRTWRRIDRRTRRLATMKATTTRAAAYKAAALLQTAEVDGRGADAFDNLAVSLAEDVGVLGVEAALLPQEVGGNFAGYHRGILEAHAAMEAAPAGTSDEALDTYMDRWGAIDRLALMDHPHTMADAVAALAYARREFHQFHVEIEESAGEDVCEGDRLILHLLDGAAAVLKRVVQRDAADADLARTSDRAVTLADLADLDFEPWAKDDFEPHTNQEWAKLANPHLITARVAVTLCHKTKAELVEMVRGMPEEGVGSAQNMSDWLTQTQDFFKGYGELISAGWTRLMSAGATVAREQGEPEAQPDFGKPAVSHVEPDRRAVAAYRQWLDMESRLLGAEMYPEGGEDAVRFVPMNTAANDYHFPSGAMANWRDLPQPMSRAEAMCRVLGIDWTTDEARDEHFLPVAPAAAESEAA